MKKIKFFRGGTHTSILDSYKLISEFETTSERECIKFDKENEKIYSRLLSQSKKAHKAIKNSGLSMTLEVPIPPRPSNRDRFLIWEKRNISKKVIDQTDSVLYLQSQGYIFNEHYEAYQAIDLANQIRKQNGETIDFKDKSKNFDDVYTKNDKNILRRKSISRLSRSIEPDHPPYHNRFRVSSYSDYGNGNYVRNSANNINNINNINNDSRVSDYRDRIDTNDEIEPIRYGFPSPSVRFEENVMDSKTIKRKASIYEKDVNNSNKQSTLYPNINYKNIETRNNYINNVKPSAPPASTNIYINNDKDNAKLGSTKSLNYHNNYMDDEFC